jgi:Fe-S cluster assembly protein SufB
MDDNKKKIDAIIGEYQFGFHTESKPVFDTGKGLNEDIIHN